MALGLEELAVASSCEVLPLGQRKKLTRHYFRWTTPFGVAPLRELKALRAVRIEGCLRRDERLRGLPGAQCTCAGARQAYRGCGITRGWWCAGLGTHWRPGEVSQAGNGAYRLSERTELTQGP